MNLLLSAAMLIAGVVPPGIRHAHAGGDCTHSHGSCEDCGVGSERHSHSHRSHVHRDGATHHHDAPAPVDDDSLTPTPVAHLHFALFGFDLNLPLRQPAGSEPREGDSQARLESVVRLSIEQPVTVKADTGSIAPVLLNLGQSIQLPQTKPLVSIVPVTSDLRCDSARLERSGVRLI